MKKKILLVDTSFSAKPIYDYLLKTEGEVFVIGGNPNDALAKSVDNYIDINYSEIDNVRSVLDTYGIDYLVPGGNDLSYEVCSEINEDGRFYNIDPIEVNDTINNKEKFREFSQANELHVPKLLQVEEIEHYLPVIVKPVDAYSGHGMTIIRDADKNKIKDAIDKAIEYSRSKNYLIEEYVEGQLFSHSAFITDGEIGIDFIVEEHCVVNEYAVDTSFVVQEFDHEMLQAIRYDITKMSRELQLDDGLIHTQFIVNNGSFWMIEVTRRCPGDLYSQLIELSTGFPYAEYYAKPFLGLKNEYNDTTVKDNKILRHTVSLPDDGDFHSLHFDQGANMKKYVPLIVTGDRVQESPFGRIGIAFFQTQTEEDFTALLTRTINRELYAVDV